MSAGWNVSLAALGPELLLTRPGLHSSNSNSRKTTMRMVKRPVLMTADNVC